jgi:hypothetical protein
LTKLKVVRVGRLWGVEQNSVLVDVRRTFRQACIVAHEWLNKGWVVGKGGTKR